MSKLTLDQASTIIDTALAKAREAGMQPLGIAVLDAGGHLLAFKRHENSSLLRPKVAMGKAYAVLNMGVGGREIARRASVMPPLFFTALIELSEGNMITLPGGVLIRDAEGDIIGSVGVSGDTSDNDELVAVAGIRAAGLIADTGAPPQ